MILGAVPLDKVSAIWIEEKVTSFTHYSLKMKYVNAAFKRQEILEYLVLFASNTFKQ